MGKSLNLSKKILSRFTPEGGKGPIGVKLKSPLGTRGIMIRKIKMIGP